MDVPPRTPFIPHESVESRGFERSISISSLKRLLVQLILIQGTQAESSSFSFVFTVEVTGILDSGVVGIDVF